MIKILVTCVGSGVGQSVLDSVNLIRDDYFVIGCDGNRNVYAHSFCDKFYIVPSIFSAEYLDFILNIAIANKVDLIIPGNDQELILFSKNIEKFESKGIKVLVSEPEIIEVSRNKKEWFDYFHPLGCNIVPTYMMSDFKENPDESIFPAIVKPAGGSASQGISILNSLEDLKGLNDEDIIQPYLFPETTDPNFKSIEVAVKQGKFLQKSEISIQLLFNKKSEFSGIFISNNSLKNGVPIFVDPIDPEKFLYKDEILKFVPILEKKKVVGPVNIQGRATPNGLYFFEMNMRFTGITGNRALLGFNEVDFLIKDFLGKTPKQLSSYAKNRLGVRQVACSAISRKIVADVEKNIFVLGAGSEVGQHFIKKNNKRFNKFFLISRETSLDKYEKLFSGYSNVEIISSESPLAFELLTQSDIFINFVSALAYQQDIEKFDAIEFVHYWVLKAAKAKIPLFINTSSQSVYPQDFNEPKTELSETKNHSAYAFQKRMMEIFFESVREISVSSNAVSLRLPRILNPSNLKQTGFFGKIVGDIIEKKEVTIDLPNNNTNIIHIDDVVRAIEFIIEHSSDNLPSKLNVSGDNITMGDFCKAVEQLVGNGFKANYGTDPSVKVSSMLDGNLIKGLGYEKSKSVEDIINELIENK
ncbi:NAD-dependent epimerase/dehydratase family protein [Riemerella anatipestifer]|uniref:NAD-dependent epimerase/dehydratase family protein n=1 Tax=Riemerella anatipestifer TaxID=34085 RepID=UPI002A870316|nr:NAD-dependent epimerase/dehydratase family protein [Riemerella anatipestifer]